MFNELDATNRILRILGEMKVNQIEEYDESSIAHDILIEKKNQVLSKGWFFNTDESFTLLRDTNNYIYIPTNTLKIENITDENGEELNCVIRGDRLYDKVNNTFKFNFNIIADITINLNFDDLIIQAKEYITCLAAETYSNNMDGSQTLYNLNKKNLEKAEYELFQIDLDSQNLVHNGNSKIYNNR